MAVHDTDHKGKHGKKSEEEGKGDYNALHKHDGRGLQFLSVLFRSHGSIVPRSLPVAVFSAFISICLMIVDRFNLVKKAYLPILHHPIAVQMLGIVLGYVIVLRCNVAVGRYFEAMSHIQFFGSKWVDALSQLCAFIRSSAIIHKRNGREEMVPILMQLQADLLHWFSLLHAVAINSLQITQLDFDEDFFFSRQSIIALPDIDPSNMKNADSAAVENLHTTLAQHKGSIKRSSVGSGAMAKEQEATASMLHPLTVLGEIQYEEKICLSKCEDKVDLVHAWIIQAVSNAALNQHILTASPIISRVYQELSNGMLGYNQAYKIALVQFPFAFAQMLTIFLLAFVLCCPIAVFVFTGGEFLTPALTLFTVLGFWGIHEIAVEVENPYGAGANHLPMVPVHDSVCEALFEATMATKPPMNCLRKRQQPSQSQ